MRRIYFLVPDVLCAKVIVDELLLKHVEWRHIHVIASDTTPLEDLPEATLVQRSDLLPALARGTAAGAITGMLAGLVAMAFPPAGLAIAGGAVVSLTVAGASFGAWAATLIGVNVPNTRLRQFEEAIAGGEVLMLIDVPRSRVDEIEQVIKQRHPEADIKGADPTIPAFP